MVDLSSDIGGKVGAMRIVLSFSDRSRGDAGPGRSQCDTCIPAQVHDSPGATFRRIIAYEISTLGGSGTYA